MVSHSLTIRKNSLCHFAIFMIILVMTQFIIIPSYSLSDGIEAVDNKSASNTGTADASILDPNTQIEQLTVLESNLLQQLHAQQMGIEASKEGIRLIEKELISKQNQIMELENQIEITNIKLQENKDALAEVLVSYQKTGVGSQLELLLSSGNLSDFLQRLSIFKEMNLQATVILEDLKTGREVQQAKKDEQSVLLAILDDQKNAKTIALSEMQKNEIALSNQLSALASDRQQYEEALALLQIKWDEATLLFPKMTKVFTQIVSTGSFSEDSLEMDISLFGIKASLHEKTFQEILNAEEKWPKSTFHFNKDIVLLDLPEYDLSLTGTFQIVDETTLVYDVSSGTQGGTPLEEIQIDQLSKNGSLTFNITPLLQGGSITKISVQDGVIVLNIAISFF